VLSSTEHIVSEINAMSCYVMLYEISVRTSKRSMDIDERRPTSHFWKIQSANIAAMHYPIHFMYVGLHRPNFTPQTL